MKYLDGVKSAKYKPLTDVLLFMIITVAVHKLWWMNSGFLYSLKPFISISAWLSHEVFLMSSWINLHLLGMKMQMADHNIMIFLQNNRSIVIEESCSGFKQMCQILILFVLFPGPWKHKLWFIPSCIFIMFFVNVFRVIVLSYTMIHLPEQWDFIHLWVMRPFYYLVIFLMWVLWVSKFRGRSDATRRTTG